MLAKIFGWQVFVIQVINLQWPLRYKCSNHSITLSYTGVIYLKYLYLSLSHMFGTYEGWYASRF